MGGAAPEEGEALQHNGTVPAQGVSHAWYQLQGLWCKSFPVA